MKIKRRLSTVSNDNDENSFGSLCKPTIEKCLFCDQQFNNRYEVLIHTASHIIIPLLKQELHQCPECLFHFSTLDSLKYHTYLKHGSSTSMLNFGDDLQDDQIRVDEDKDPQKNVLIGFVESQPIVKCMGLDLPLLNNTKMSRIVFEDDDDEDDDEPHSGQSELVDEELVPSAEHISDTSIHNDVLKQRGQFKCKKCGLKFVTWYNLIIHETSHMYFKKSKPSLCRVCERYIDSKTTNMKDHLLAKHNEIQKDVCCPNKCRKCHLYYYNYRRHVMNYHEIYKCMTCGKGFEIKTERDRHILDCTSCLDKSGRRWSSRVSKLCEFCYTFFKNKNHSNFVLMGDFNELGYRHSCNRCGQKCFDLKIVKCWHLTRDKKLKVTTTQSNQARLSRIQKRLKMLKMNYFLCFIYTFPNLSRWNTQTQNNLYLIRLDKEVLSNRRKSQMLQKLPPDSEGWFY